MTESKTRALYLRCATPEVYELIESRAPAAVEVVTLESDAADERREKIRDAEVVIVASEPLTAELIAAAHRLHLVHHQGVGYEDTVDGSALRERGIPLALAPEGTTESAAEHAVLLMLALCRRLPFADAELRRGRWHMNTLRPVSRALGKLRVGYVGMGRIGRAVAERLRPFGCRGAYADPVPLDAGSEAELGLARVSFDELLRDSDVVTLHVPLTPRTRRLLDAEAFRKMRPGALVVNTARGGLIDEAALCEALASGRLGGAGLDVFEEEPLSASSPLLGFPNVVLTPHIAAGTRDALIEKMDAVFANIARFLRGEPLRNLVSWND